MPIDAEGSRQFYYWVKFDKTREPKMFVAKNWMDLMMLLDREVQTYGDVPEWIIRDYAKG